MKFTNLTVKVLVLPALLALAGCQQGAGINQADLLAPTSPSASNSAAPKASSSPAASGSPVGSASAPAAVSASGSPSPGASGSAAGAANAGAADSASPSSSGSPASGSPGSAGGISNGELTSTLAVFLAPNGGGGGSNVVRVINHADGKVRSQGRIQGNAIKGPNVRPVNEAFAYSSCASCQTYAVALQIDLYSKTATDVAPVNQALAVNYQCTGCTTVARAVQYVVPVDDPGRIPPRVDRLTRQMEAEINSIQRTPDITPDEAKARIDAVVAQFPDLLQYLHDKVDRHSERTTPGASPIAGDSASPSTSASPAASAASPSTSPSSSAAASATPSTSASTSSSASPVAAG